ncbi:MAG TPA: molybdenum cofactor guanylyltransferase [Thermodesulfobacteriota bacterium]|nr:molybdenum cofactor guanylyltransferase [Thermodesulfobacteriota bacterium]
MSNPFHCRLPITGLILSGGKSRRMGEDKAFIEIEGIPIIQKTCNLFQELFREVIIVTNHRELYLHLGATVHTDLISNRGALGGLYTGLIYSSFPYSFTVACDMPFLKGSVIRYLSHQVEGYDVVVPKTEDGLQPLHAIYSKSCIAPIQKTLEEKKTRIFDFYPSVRVKMIEPKEILSVDPEMESFINLNTPEELMRFKKKSFLA